VIRLEIHRVLGSTSSSSALATSVSGIASIVPRGPITNDQKISERKRQGQREVGRVGDVFGLDDRLNDEIDHLEVARIDVLIIAVAQVGCPSGG
jgi:hypothetical protein